MSGTAAPAIGAAIFAGAAVLGIQQYFHYILSAQSDSMLVTVCLAAIDCYLNGRYRWAWWLLALAALGRPEVWPFAGLYAIWAWRKVPAMRWMLFAGRAHQRVSVVRGADDHQRPARTSPASWRCRSPRECTSNKITCTVDRFTALDYLADRARALWSRSGLALLRRNRTVLVLAAAVRLWVVVEIAFVLHGFPGVPRYLFEPAGLTGVLAGVAFGWLLLDASRIHRRAARAGPGSRWRWCWWRPGSGRDLPGPRSSTRTSSTSGRGPRRSTSSAATINALGGYQPVLACGRPVINVEYVSIMAWYMHLQHRHDRLPARSSS